MTVDGQAVPFQEGIDFLAQKVALPSKAYTDLKEGAHARSFVVAGATVNSLVTGFHDAIVKALQEGRTKEQFLKEDFDRLVAQHGWDYKGGRKWRSGVIYNTNMRMAYQAGKWQQALRMAEAAAKRGETTYLRYSAILDGQTRPEHRRWHGVILPIGHPFWKTRFPPNGWGCRCTVEIITEAELRRRGLAVTKDEDLQDMEIEQREVKTTMGTEIWPTPKGVDTGFGYNVGESWLQGAVPRELQQPLRHAPSLPPPPQTRPDPLPPLPPPHDIDPQRILPAGLSQEDYIRRFLGEFGADIGHPSPLRDASGHLLAVSEELFRNRATGGFKVDKNGRERFLLLLADALRDPDEIWADWVPVENPATQEIQMVLRRRYLRNFQLPRDRAAGLERTDAGLAVFSWTDIGWQGTTLFPSDRPGYTDQQRWGVLLFKR